MLRLAEAELASAADETYRDVAPLLGAALGRADRPAHRPGATRPRSSKDDLGVRLETPERGEVVDLAALVARHPAAGLSRAAPRARPALCPGGATPPVLLDDPFAHFDAERVERTLAYLADLAADRQLIVFRRTGPRVDLAPGSAAVIELALEGAAAA